MLDHKGSYRCDAEIGKPGSWHSCNRKAHVGIDVYRGPELHYCRKHTNHIDNPVYMTRKPGAEVRDLK